MYKIGVISDTHGLLREEVKEQLKGCDAILHGGDINKQSILDELETIAKVYVVRGNNDKEWAAAIPQTLRLELFGVRFFMIHNKKQIQERQENLEDRDIIIYGHSHKYEEKYEDTGGENCEKKQLWLNPGSCGARRFQLPITMAILEISSDGTYRVQKIDLRAEGIRAGGTGIEEIGTEMDELAGRDKKRVIQAVMREVDRKTPVETIAEKQKLSLEMAEQICRLYVTHPGIDADGILNKMDKK